jgi:hypothetical protein
VNDVQWETAGMQRKILGSWKQYSGREFFGFFRWLPTNSRVSLQDPVTFPRLSCETRWQERSSWVDIDFIRISIQENMSDNNSHHESEQVIVF